IWKLSASLACSVTQAFSGLSLCMIHTISGATMHVNTPPMWAIRAMVLSSCAIAELSFSGSFTGVSPSGNWTHPPCACPDFGFAQRGCQARRVCSGARFAGHRHAPNQQRADEQVRAPVDVGAGGLDGQEYLAQVA